MRIRIVLGILNFIALIGSLCWLYNDRSWEPAVTSVGLLGALIAIFFTSDSNSSINMTQKGGAYSNNYQSGGDINVKND